MKLVGSITFVTEAGDKQIATTKDIGEATPAEERTAVFMFASQLANDIPQGASFRALSVNVE